MDKVTGCKTAMEIGGWKTESIYLRHNISTDADKQAAVEAIEQRKPSIKESVTIDYRIDTQRPDHGAVGRSRIA
jgi:hypothetical protein